METGLIYTIFCTINKQRYVGLTTQDVSKRWKDHISQAKSNPSTPLHKSIVKYGAHNHKIRIVEDDIPIDDLPDREIHWIAEFDTFHNGYNQTTGGETSKTIHDDVKDKISQTMLGVSKSPEHTNKMRETLIERNIGFSVIGDGKHCKRSVRATNVKTKEVLEFDSIIEATNFLGLERNKGGNISRAIREKFMAYGYLWERLDDRPIRKSVRGYGKWTGELLNEFDSINKASLALTGNRATGIRKSLNNPGKSTWKGCYWYYA
jgi:group I intron endonuclease